MGKGKSIRFVTESVCLSGYILVWNLGDRATYLIRSNTVMRLPTGESRQVPSGVNRMFPLQKTVPSRLENCCQALVCAKGMEKEGKGMKGARIEQEYLELSLHDGCPSQKICCIHKPSTISDVLHLTLP